MRKESGFWYKFAALFLILVLVVPVLAACGGDGGSTSPESNGEEDTGTSPESNGEEDTGASPESNGEEDTGTILTTSTLLTNGTDSWQLVTSYFGGTTIKSQFGSVETNEGWVVLEAEFESLSGASLIGVWYQESFGESSSLMEQFSREGIPNVVLLDNQSGVYPAVLLQASKITFVVPEDSRGFTLYFLDWAPIEFGY